MPPRLAPRLLLRTLSPRALALHHHHLHSFSTQSYHNTAKIPRLLPLQSKTAAFAPFRSYVSSSGKTQADQIVDELQELYETAKDEFEIATESTDGATIYAASDRESARDALSQLITVFSLYTSEDMAGRTETRDSGELEDADVDDQGRLVELEFDPAEVSDEVKGEVRRRVGQRVRELEAAVAGLEERAKSD